MPYLAPAEMTLFMSMPRSDRQHHLRVLGRVLAQGHTDQALLVAALLHDVGKTRVSFTIPDRILAVLAKRLVPRKFEVWSQADDPHGWQRAFIVSAKHPQWSAAMLEQVGSCAEAIQLVRLHQDALEVAPADLRPRLMALQQADDAS